MDKVVRTIGRCIIIRNGCLLLVEVDDGAGRWWCLPGGRQRFGETIEECVRRECHEELDCEVAVGRCLMVRELIGPRKSGPVGKVKDKHLLELFFLGELKSEPKMIPSDKELVQIRWIDLSELETVNLYPRILVDWIPSVSGTADTKAIYVGDVD